MRTKGATVALDVCLSPGAPSLLSVGQRVMEAGMSFFWMAGEKPCFITTDLRYIVIFEIQNNVPVYAPCSENLKQTLLGALALTYNAYMDRCGLAVGSTGRIYSMLKMDPKLRPLIMFANNLCVDCDKK